MNKKPIIGILPVSNFLKTDNPTKDTYLYTNTYIKAIYENGGIPYFIPVVDDRIVMDNLSHVDGLFLQGGYYVSQFHFDGIDYFFKNKKSILGVCLGMQELAMYSINIEEDGRRILTDIETGINHRPYEMTRDNSEILVHDILIESNSRLYDIYKTDRLKVNSLHQHTINAVGSKFKITARSTDGLIECIELKDENHFVMGTQFHPELNPNLRRIIKEFVDSCI